MPAFRSHKDQRSVRADNYQCVFRMLRPLLFSHMGSSGLLIQFLRKGNPLFVCKGYAQEWTQNVEGQEDSLMS